jgi:WD40-like Beta Propeller Repeat
VIGDSGAELWLYDMRERRPQPFSDVRGAGPANSVFSPDGRWLAYTSRSGRPVIFVEPVPATGSRYQVSPFNDVGHHPFWSPDGRRLYYFGISGGTLVTVPVTTQPVFAVGETTVVPGSHISNTTALGPLNYDITADDRFVRVANQAVIAGRTSLALRVVVNWFEELKQRVAAR